MSGVARPKNLIKITEPRDAYFTRQFVFIYNQFVPRPLHDSTPTMAQVFDNEKFSDRVMCLKKRKREDAALDAQDDGESTVIKRVHVSSAMLAIASPMFEVMLAGPMLESKEKEFKIEVGDEKEAEHLTTLIKAIYTESLPESAASADLLALLALADKFQGR